MHGGDGLGAVPPGATGRPSAVGAAGGLLDGVAVASGWLVLASADPSIGAEPVAVRLGLSLALGAGGGLAGAALCLVGSDARCRVTDAPEAGLARPGESGL